MSGFSGVKTLGFAQSRHERKVSLSYYKLSKKIELVSKKLEKNLKSKNNEAFLLSNHFIEGVLLSLKITPEKKDLVKEYIETPFFKALTKKNQKMN